MRPPTNPTCDTLQSEMRAEMAREHQREQENMREAEQSESGEVQEQ